MLEFLSRTYILVDYQADAFSLDYRFDYICSDIRVRSKQVYCLCGSRSGSCFRYLLQHPRQPLHVLCYMRHVAVGRSLHYYLCRETPTSRSLPADDRHKRPDYLGC